MLNNKINKNQKTEIKGFTLHAIKGFTLTNNLYDNLIPLTVANCKKGVNVLTKAGSIFKIETISKNKNRNDDLTIEVGNGKHGNIYGSYNGVFPSLKIQSKC